MNSAGKEPYSAFGKVFALWLVQELVKDMTSVKCIDVLKREHEAIEKKLAEFSAFARAILKVGSADRRSITAFFDFITDFVYGVHIAKEHCLFDIIVGKGAEEISSHVLKIRNERGKLRAFVEALGKVLPGAIDGDQLSLRMLAENALAYESFLREHIKMLDGIIFEGALQVLSEEDDAVILKEFEAIDNRTAG
ncbi:MAG: hemerythrin domain-containing protein [Planctomycetota bacterium]|jgi:hemerythrin-like domain-containing protein